jgi:threonine/homoserine/homoserine lactone efflux protein
VKNSSTVTKNPITKLEIKIMNGYDLAGYLIFAFVTSITPGPNNYLLFAYGKSFGYKDSGRLMAGIFLGFFTLLYLAGYGIGELISTNQTIGLIFKIVGSAWLFYLAVVLSRPISESRNSSSQKIGFRQSFVLQFVNPKAWIMAMSGAAAFLPKLSNIHFSVFAFAITFGLVGAPCMLAWIAFGDVLSRLIKSKSTNRIVGIVLFVLMLISIVMMWM